MKTLPLRLQLGLQLGLLMVIVGVTLWAGLNPKEFSFRNEVDWVSGDAGIQFGKYGIAYTQPFLTAEQSTELASTGFTVNAALNLSPDFKNGFRFLAVFHNGDDRSQLLLGQWHDHVILMNGDDYSNALRKPRLTVKVAAGSPARRLVSFTTKGTETKIYLDGELAGASRNLSLKIPGGDVKGRLVLGNSINGKNSLLGSIHGFAVYPKALTPEDIKRHDTQWRKTGTFSFSKPEDPFLLYLFDEGGGLVARDHSDQEVPLEISAKMILPEKRRFVSPFYHFRFNREFVVDFIINLLGFMPLGFMVAAVFNRAGGVFFKRHGMLIAVGLGFSLSFGIEFLQSWMPSRTSSLLDLLLNTVGALLGAIAFRIASAAGARIGRSQA